MRCVLSCPVKCWQIQRQTKAPQTAGTHTDFEKGSICAEVMKFEDLKELGSEPAVKAAGKYRQEGKNMRGPRRRCHIVQVQCFSWCS
ncbi:Obg-like ATPase 1 [Camellia lanceoleosa]|uniref:Obg-like ATPase 1 n=1 Tax=Camellia lanceoleosa TaxID=1840588 RepID=A0ACC0GM96_9ERIC|nr:Obg-like ATPase 1 [Camellia lanceoleosa]